MTAHVPRINRRALTVFLIIGLPLLAAGIGLVLAIGQSQLRESYGVHLGQIAQQTAADIDAYVYRRLLDVSLLGRSPDLRRAAVAASARPVDRAAIDRIDAEWRRTGTAPPGVTDVLTNPTSQYLADLVAHDQIYKEMLLTDREGRLVAASNASEDYYQADEDWWKAAYDDGTRGRVILTDVEWDPSASRYAIEIVVPVPMPGSDALAGILKVVADSREMLGMVGGVQLGATGEALLLRDNGSIVFSRRPMDPGARFFASEELRERASSLRKGAPQHVSFFPAGREDGEQELVAIAPSQLASSYPNVPWMIAVTQSEGELLAPVRALSWYLFAVFVLTAVAVFVFALWFSMRLEEPSVTDDMHLNEHPRVTHVGETDDPLLHGR